MNKLEKKKFRIILWFMLVLSLFAMGVCVAGVTDYVDRVPKISVKEALEVMSGETLSVSDLAKITCKGKYTVSLTIAETNVESAKVLDSEDPKLEGDGTERKSGEPALYVGDGAGYIRLMIDATGSVAEHVSACVTVYVKPGEVEQTHLLKEAEDQFVKIKEYLEERNFSDQKAVLAEEHFALYYLDPVKQIGYAKYYLKRVEGDQEHKHMEGDQEHKHMEGDQEHVTDAQEVYYEILTNYELVSKDVGPQLKDVLTRELDKEAFCQACDLPEKVILIKEQEP